MVTLFLDDNKTNDDGDSKENGTKYYVYIHKQQDAILYISLPMFHHYDMKLPNFTSLLYGVGEHNKKNCCFLFLNLDNNI